MKWGFPLAAICLVLALLLAASPTTQTTKIPLSVADLNRPVIAELGLPLGTAAEIEATLINGRDLKIKEYDGRYLLRVTRVNGKRLKDEPVVEFLAPTFADVDLPSNAFGLYESRNGKKAGSLSSAEISKLEKGYIGATVRLLAYETGGFSGRPELPKEAPLWQDHGFGFSTYLMVIMKRP